MHQLYDSLTTEASFYEICNTLCNIFTGQPIRIKEWLASLQSAISIEESVPSHVTFLVTSICVVSRDSDIVETTLKLLQSNAKYAPDEVNVYLS